VGLFGIQLITIYNKPLEYATELGFSAPRATFV